jgi:hypothetical protein
MVASQQSTPSGGQHASPTQRESVRRVVVHRHSYAERHVTRHVKVVRHKHVRGTNTWVRPTPGTKEGSAPTNMAPAPASASGWR